MPYHRNAQLFYNAALVLKIPPQLNNTAAHYYGISLKILNIFNKYTDYALQLLGAAQTKKVHIILKFHIPSETQINHEISHSSKTKT